VPEVTQVGRRTGRAELDEHAEGVHYTEMDVDLKASTAAATQIIADIRQRLAVLPAVTNVGQPISHRLDHLLSGVRAQIALKVYGDDLDTLRGLAADLRDRLAKIPGITDLQIEKQVLIPQVKIRVDYEKAARLRRRARALLRGLEQMIEGERITQIVEGNRRFDLVVRLPEGGARPADAGGSADRDAGRARAAVEDRQRRGKRRPQPGQPRELAPPHRAFGQYRRPRHGEGDRRHPRRAGRQALAGRLLHGARRAVPGAGAGIATDRLARRRIADHDLLVLYSRYRSTALTADHHGQHPAGAGRQRHRAVDFRAAAVGRRAGRLHHAHRHRHAQRHSQDQPLHQPVRLRGRASAST
jgi:hypothetical protein